MWRFAQVFQRGTRVTQPVKQEIPLNCALHQIDQIFAQTHCLKAFFQNCQLGRVSSWTRRLFDHRLIVARPKIQIFPPRENDRFLQRPGSKPVSNETFHQLSEHLHNLFEGLRDAKFDFCHCGVFSVGSGGFLCKDSFNQSIQDETDANIFSSRFLLWRKRIDPSSCAP